MLKNINFRTVDPPYDKIIDKFIEPIECFLPMSTKCIDYHEGSLNVSFFHETPPHGGVFISHGLADKAWRNAPNVYDYDAIFVSGPLWKEKMIGQGIASEKICINGFTKLDPLFSMPKTARKDKLRLLFAPSHNFLSGMHEQLGLSSLPEDICLIESSHPFSNANNMTYEQFLFADVVISDCSSTLYEAWALGIPVVFPDFLVKDAILEIMPDTFEEKIYKESIGYHAASQTEMLELIYKAGALGVDPLAKDLMEGIFPSSLRGNSGKCTAQLLLDIPMEYEI